MPWNCHSFSDQLSTTICCKPYKGMRNQEGGLQTANINMSKILVGIVGRRYFVEQVLKYNLKVVLAILRQYKLGGSHLN